MTAISALYSRVAPRVANCPEPTILQAIQDAAIEFCSDSRIVTAFAPLACVAGTQTYTAPANADTNLEAHVVMRVWFKDRELVPAADNLIDLPEVVRATSFGIQQSGDPRRFLRGLDGTFTVYPVPNTSITDGFTVMTAFRPTLTATTVPDVLMTQWRDGIISGALARLRSMPGQPWSGNASSDQTFFNYYKARARVVAKQGQVMAPLRVGTRGFGR